MKQVQVQQSTAVVGSGRLLGVVDERLSLTNQLLGALVLPCSALLCAGTRFWPHLPLYSCKRHLDLDCLQVGGSLKKDWALLSGLGIPKSRAYQQHPEIASKKKADQKSPSQHTFAQTQT